MEPLFEIRCYANMARLTEFYRKLGTSRVLKGLSILLWIVMVWCTILSVWMQSLPGILPMLLTFVLITLFEQLMPWWISWISLRNVTRQNDGQVPESIITVDDRAICLAEGAVTVTVEYRKIQRVVRLKHSYVLMNGKHTGLMLDPDGFTKGTLSAFQQFLREKRPDLNIPE